MRSIRARIESEHTRPHGESKTEVVTNLGLPRLNAILDRMSILGIMMQLMITRLLLPYLILTRY